jgi:hypothetical protein
LASITKDYGIRYMNRLRKWWLGKTVSIVHVGLNYAVRKPIFDLFRVITTGDRYEYLDLGFNTTIHKPVTAKQGVYGMPRSIEKSDEILIPRPTKIQWWTTDDTITKYCVDPDLQKIVNARNALLIWKPPSMSRLPKVSKVENVPMELAQQKLAGATKETK